MSHILELPLGCYHHLIGLDSGVKFNLQIMFESMPLLNHSLAYSSRKFAPSSSKHFMNICAKMLGKQVLCFKGYVVQSGRLMSELATVEGFTGSEP